MLTENISVFGEGRQEAYGFHNVQGALRAANTDTVNYVTKHYGFRCGHVPDISTSAGVIVYENSEELSSQWKYLSNVMGTNIKLQELDFFRTNSGLVVPYINTPETEQLLQSRGAEVWGLPSQMVNSLKNKAESHLLMQELKIKGIETPNFRVCTTDQCLHTSLEVLKESEEIYQSVGMTEYPRGIMIRAAESDGNYGACMLKEQNGVINIVPDGNPSEGLIETNWRRALEKANAHLESGMDLSKENRVVISRLVDIIDSPGLSVFIVDGKVMPLGWNGQVQPEGGTACVGTSSYQPRSEIAERIFKDYESYSTQVFETLLRSTAKKTGVDFNKIRGACNIDLMIPGKMELELQRKTNKFTPFYVAEINPRLTNLTDALMLALWAERMPINVANMRGILRHGLLTFDKFPFPGNVDPRSFRDSIQKIDSELKKSGTRIITRMPDNPMGLVMVGDTKTAQEELSKLIRKLQ